ncbi:unnamed protein product [Cylicocyclus nassatus]|uniref:Uncharacterized protein n=1 Tax=Cylicocyclus nassatus TaxID=53992 RepID=A0AA36MC59_CYLNA|nr:unnamed protein product [Cylicocyclus nassatus]
MESGRLTSFVSTLQGLYFFSALFVLSVSAIILLIAVSMTPERTCNITGTAGTELERRWHDTGTNNLAA